MQKIIYLTPFFLLLFIPIHAYSQQVSDLNAEVKYPKVLYLNSPEQIEVTVKNVGALPASQVSVRFDVANVGPTIILKEKNGPEVLKLGDSMKFVFDVIAKIEGVYKVTAVWGWTESEHITREKQDTLPTPISVQEQLFTFNLGWILMIASASGGAAYIVYHTRRKMRKMEQEADMERNPDSDKEDTN